MEATYVSISVKTDKENVVYIHTIEYYSSIKKKEILPFATTWMDLNGTMLSKISQTEKDKYYRISFICRTKNKLKL